MSGRGEKKVKEGEGGEPLDVIKRYGGPPQMELPHKTQLTLAK